jgi:hypothetical protein
MVRPGFVLRSALAACIGLVLVTSPAETVEASSLAACMEPGNLCLEPLKGAKWQPGKKATRKDRKRRGRGKAGSLFLTIDNGRGSVFINGRYAGTAPLDGTAIPSGKNHIQVRDGMIVLSDGLLTVPRGGILRATVNHP